MFGEVCGSRNVSILSVTGVNTDIMKVIKLVLESNPCSILSMTTLGGGPEWQGQKGLSGGKVNIKDPVPNYITCSLTD
jgi:hypothetical protein